MADWIEDVDDDFDEQFTKFHAFVADNGATHGLTTGQISAVDNLHTAWGPAFAAYKAAQTAAVSTTATKNNMRDDIEALMRTLAAILQTNVNMTDAKRNDSGLAVRSTTRTRAPVPTTRAVLTADNSQRLQTTLRWRDESTPNSRKKPEGVKHLEIRCWVGPNPPADPAEFHYCACDSAEPYVMEHAAADATKNAYYVGRWENTHREFGPFSETVMATISA